MTTFTPIVTCAAVGDEHGNLVLKGEPRFNELSRIVKKGDKFMRGSTEWEVVGLDGDGVVIESEGKMRHTVARFLLQ